ncbi:MAG: ubiquitin carboxyl-terminal hydrolase [Barrevirus sp.]|uniref:Ubiquitin carboxyl-terminal hydrolase n=1 Tax=Barrevirus sp. TaxID=2487763 RepID=A0A3G4ZTC7_9VIRU|nr:MAG: ubiquitin carboxyl-terminal hydrolase [Barrevirus sp.]
MNPFVDIPDEQEQEPTKITVRGLSGLENIGNTCYMNSVIQCLNSLDLFRSYLLNREFYERQLYSNKMDVMAQNKRKKAGLVNDAKVAIGGEETIIKAVSHLLTVKLAKLFEKMWHRNYSIKPVSLKKVIGNTCSTFSGYRQNDSHELLNLILDTVHEETKSKVKVIYPRVPTDVENYVQVKRECTEKITDESLVPEERERYLSYLKQYRSTHLSSAIISDAYLFWKKYIEKSYSLITDLFTGLLYSKITCEICKNVTWAFDPFTNLSLPTPDFGNIHIHDILQKFVGEELLDNQDKYFCTECNKKVDAVKETRIWEPPNILIIHLKRFKIMGPTIVNKTLASVKFPIENLDISSYMSPIHIVGKTVYDLRAISDHNGSTCNSGHYVAYCKNSLSGLWYKFNDERVIHIPNEYVEEEIVTKDAYLLFYERRL